MSRTDGGRDEPSSFEEESSEKSQFEWFESEANGIIEDEVFCCWSRGKRPSRIKLSWSQPRSWVPSSTRINQQMAVKSSKLLDSRTGLGSTTLSLAEVG